MKKCPVCKTKLRFGDKQCSKCGYVFLSKTPVSILCLAGFICAVLPIVIYVILKITRLTNSLIGVIIGWIALIAGIVLSLAGMIRDKKKKIGLGAAGITIAILELIPWTFFRS